MHKIKLLKHFIVKNAFSLLFIWQFRIFYVILQPQTNKNTTYEGKE